MSGGCARSPQVQPRRANHTVTNQLGPFTGRLTGGTFGAARELHPSISHQGRQQYTVDVPPCATSFRAALAKSSDVQADLDLYVLDCTTGTCTEAGASFSPTAMEKVTITDPAPGRWVVVVDGFDVPAGTTAYDYVDSFANPAFGSITADDANTPRSAGPSSWTVAEVKVGSAPSPDRVLLGDLEVRTQSDQVIGAAAVVVERTTG